MGLDPALLNKIQTLEQEILKDNKNANNIVKLMKLLEAKKEPVVFLGFKSLQRVFTHFIEKGDLKKIYEGTEFSAATNKRKREQEDGSEGEEEKGEEQEDGEGEEEVAEPSKKKAKTEEANGHQNGKSKKDSPEKVFSQWLLSLYNKYIVKLLSLLWHDIEGIQTKAMDSLFHFVKLESKMQCTARNRFPVLQPHLLQKIVEKVVQFSGTTTAPFPYFRDKYFTAFQDVQYMTFWVLANTSLLTHKENITFQHESTVFDIFISFKGKGKQPQYFMDRPNEEEGEKQDKKKLRELAGKDKLVDWFSIQKQEGMKKQYSEALLKFLNLKLSKEMLKKILYKMETLLPFMTNAFLVMDFLNKCYAMGGIFSILALHGIFIEITKFNLDFKDFYKRLYSLFDTGVLQTKYRGSFFKLAIRFMYSKLLPSYTAAAFVKKLLRIALAAPPSGAILALAFAYNVLQIHPSIQVMLHRTPKQEDDQSNTPPVLLLHSAVGNDPFDAENENPAKCNAINSSLWELWAFTNHQSPTVSKMAQSLVGKLTQTPFDMEQLAGASYATMIDAELQEISSTTPVNFIPKHTLFEGVFTGWVLPK